MPQPKFICDMMFGRLAKWLRILGYDTLYFRSIDDGELLRIAKDEARIVLTRDTLIIQRRPVKRSEIKSLLIKSNELEVQLEEVFSAFGLEPQKPRCGICNASLNNVSKRDIEGLVPPYVFATQDEFSTCPICQRVYWKATHWKGIQALIAKSLGR